MPREGSLKREAEAGLSPVVMAHVFRGELSRSDRWRTRLDTTTNWALTTTAAVISIGFSSPAASHVTFLVGIWMVVTFLMIEARRYRYYDLWNRRLRLLEEGYWAPLLRKEPVDPDALKELAHEMERPQIQLSLFSAVATRINRAYGPILLVLLFTWFVKIYSHPQEADSPRMLLERAHVGPISGGLVVSLLLLATLLFLLVFVVSMFSRAPLGELRARPHPRSFSVRSAFRPYAYAEPRRRPRHRAPKTEPPLPEPPVQ